MFKKLLALPLLMLSLSVSGQIDSGINIPSPIEESYVYDSLMNFPNDGTGGYFFYPYLVGQTVYCAQPAATKHIFSCEGVPGHFYSDKAFGMKFKIEDTSINHLSLRNIQDGKQYLFVGDDAYNTVFVVEGYYKKMVELLEGRDFVSKGNNLLTVFHNPTNYEEVKVPDGSVWHCDKVYVDTTNVNVRFGYFYHYGPAVVMSLSNPKYGKAIVYTGDTGLFPVYIKKSLQETVEKRLIYYIPKKTSPKPAQSRSKSAARRRR